MSIRIVFNGRVLTAIAMLSIFSSATILALGFPEKARLMPLMVGIPASLLAMVQVVLEFRKAIKEQQRDEEGEVKKEVHMFLWLLAFFIGILCFGFVYAAPILVFSFLYWGKREGVKAAIFGAVGTWVVLYGLFELAFEIPLFSGLVVEWFLG